MPRNEQGGQHKSGRETTLSWGLSLGFFIAKHCSCIDELRWR